jgi:hypothetical protein
MIECIANCLIEANFLGFSARPGVQQGGFAGLMRGFTRSLIRAHDGAKFCVLEKKIAMTERSE